MATATYVPIATTTLGSSSSTIDFNSIPGTYTDLRVVLSNVVTSVDNAGVWMRYNNDSATNYSFTRIMGNGTAASTDGSSAFAQVVMNVGGGSSSSSTTPTFYTVDIFNYAGSTFKTSLGTASEDKNGSGITWAGVNLWRSTSAITTITLLLSSGNYNTNTTATLYGIKAA